MVIHFYKYISNPLIYPSEGFMLFFMGRWRKRLREKRARRALERQLAYQVKKAADITGNEKHLLPGMMKHSGEIKRKIENFETIKPESKVLEVGCGSTGIIFSLNAGKRFGVDPLSAEYSRLFPLWQKNTTTVSALGEALPFSSSSFDIVLNDNVIDHAEEPLKIIDECARVLKPGGLLYFTVNIHHPFYSLASGLHGLWNGIGIKFEISPFADHTVHLTEAILFERFAGLPLEILEKRSTTTETALEQRAYRGLSPERLIKKFFFKNALLEIISRKK